MIYADREHSANLAYLTGFDPRFEEAVLIVGPDGDPAILVGNECWGMAGAAPLPMRRHRFQDLSLPGQPRDRSAPLADILADEGIGPGSKVGIIGWKTYAHPEQSDAPSYLVDALRAAVGGSGSVENATGLLIDAADGLRVINEVEQLAAMEWAACQTSAGVLRLLRNVRPGMTEREAVALLGWNGWPLSCHLMLTAGPRAALGLLSPGDRPIQHGDPFTVAFGIWGALNCRAGFAVESAGQLPNEVGDYVERLVAPYFAAVAEWYGALHIGQTGGTLHEIVARRLGDPFFGIFLNPGHQIHLDEWVNSPIAPGSTTELRSGMAFQVDIIPATGTAVLHHQHRGRHRPGRRRAAESAGRAVPGRLATHPGTERLHGRRAGDRAASRRPALLEHPRLAAALPARAASGPWSSPARRPVDELRIGDGSLEAVLLPEAGARLHRLRAFGHDLLRTPPDPSQHLREPIFWGGYLMAPWCNRLAARATPVGGRTVNLAANFPDGSAIHGQVHAIPWTVTGRGDVLRPGRRRWLAVALRGHPGGGSARRLAVTALAPDQPGR